MWKALFVHLPLRTILIQSRIPDLGNQVKHYLQNGSHFDNKLFLKVQNRGVFMYADRSDSRV